MITKLVFKCLFSILLFFGIANVLSYMSTGKPIFSKDDLFFWRNWQNPTATITPRINPSTTTEVYKWKDENGVTHYSSEEPPAHLLSQKLAVNPNTNLIQGDRSEPEPEQAQQESKQEPTIQGPLYHPDTIKELTDKAKDVERLLQERAEQQEKILEGL